MVSTATGCLSHRRNNETKCNPHISARMLFSGVVYHRSFFIRSEVISFRVNFGGLLAWFRRRRITDQELRPQNWAGNFEGRYFETSLPNSITVFSNIRRLFQVQLWKFPFWCRFQNPPKWRS